MLVDIAESMTEGDKLEARRIVVAYARALGYSIEVYSTYERQYRVDVSNGIRSVVLCAQAWTSAGAFVWCCREIAKSVKAGLPVGIAGES